MQVKSNAGKNATSKILSFFAQKIFVGQFPNISWQLAYSPTSPCFSDKKKTKLPRHVIAISI